MILLYKLSAFLQRKERKEIFLHIYSLLNRKAQLYTFWIPVLYRTKSSLIAHTH